MGELVAFRQRDDKATRHRGALPGDGTLGKIALFTGVRYERGRDFAARETDVRCSDSSDSPDAPGAGPHTRRA